MGGPLRRRGHGRKRRLRLRDNITYRDITSGNNGARPLGFDLVQRPRQLDRNDAAHSQPLSRNGVRKVCPVQDEFDLWFKQRVLDISGLDLDNSPEMERPEFLSLYETRVEALRS